MSEICRAVRLGGRIWSTDSANAGVVADPSRISVAASRCRERAAMSVVFLRQLRGTLPLAFFFSSRRRHTRCSRDWSSDVCSSDLRLRIEERTIILYEAPHRVAECVAEALETLGDRQACLAREVTKLHEEFVRGKLSEIDRKSVV